jgi:Exostosin family
VHSAVYEGPEFALSKFSCAFCCCLLAVYEGPAFDWLKNCSKNAAESMRHHRHYKHGDDVAFVQDAMSHPWRVQNAADAVLFVVPVLLTFGVRHTDECGLSYKQMQNITAAALAQSPWFIASGGRDHIIVASSFQQRDSKFYTSNFKAVMQNMIFGNLEIYPRASFRYEHWHTSLWRCTVVTPYMDRFHPLANRTQTLDQFKRRQFQVFFIGQVDDRKEYHIRRKIGDILQPLHELKGVYASVSAADSSKFSDLCAADCAMTGRCMMCRLTRENSNYLGKLVESQFSLMLLGDTSSSSRLYDSISSGTIPIMVSSMNDVHV